MLRMTRKRQKEKQTNPGLHLTLKLYAETVSSDSMQTVPLTASNMEAALYLPHSVAHPSPCTVSEEHCTYACWLAVATTSHTCSDESAGALGTWLYDSFCVARARHTLFNSSKELGVAAGLPHLQCESTLDDFRAT